MAVAETQHIARYLDLPYQVAVARRGGKDGRGWTAEVEELPGCEAQGASPEEAVAALRGAMEAWLAKALECGRPVPQPRAATTHSGRLLLRMPPTLHGELARLADREKVSLNALIIGILGGAVAWRQPAGPSAAGRAEQDGPGAGSAAPHGADPPPRISRAKLLQLAVATNVVFVVVTALVAIGLLVVALAG